MALRYTTGTLPCIPGIGRSWGNVGGRGSQPPLSQRRMARHQGSTAGFGIGCGASARTMLWVGGGCVDAGGGGGLAK